MGFSLGHDIGDGAGPSSPFGVGDALDGAAVLVIDDQEANVLLLERLLQRAGVRRVVGLTDSRLAVERFIDVQPDLVLLDLHMPHLDGIAVIEALQAVMPPQSFTPIVVLTADTTGVAKEQALSRGAKDFLTKPFEHTEVLLRVKNLLETRSLHAELQRHNADLQAEIARRTEHERQLAQERDRQRQRIRDVLDGGPLTMAFQPIVEIPLSRVVGVEALSRFGAPVPPDQWFATAAAVGLGTELELFAVRSAVAQIDRLPEGVYLSVNVSPHTALQPALAEIVEPFGPRIVIELTEHVPVDAYGDLAYALGRLRASGARIAVDDAGSGYSSLQHILQLHPDIIKLDIALVRDIDRDPARRALAAGLVMFAAETGAAITAEGIETGDELAALARLGVRFGQGYYLGRPAAL